MRLRLVWLLLLVAGCGLNRFGPWLDESGQRLEGSQVIQYQGFQTCGHEEVIFLFFFGDLYARDDDGDLGQLTNDEGEVLTFAVLDEPPAAAEPTGITHQDREIYFDPATREDYLYIRQPNRTERWPRAEINCDRPGTPRTTT
ncbi:MAG TPA: hypothetical protein VJR05_05285 [Acidimicrobiia bacterium]|nr:hypothetical protein [Acidimicrobiia bacterium]